MSSYIKRVLKCMRGFAFIGMFFSLLATLVSMFNSSYLMILIVTVTLNLAIFIFTVRKLYKYRLTHGGKKIYYFFNLPAMSAYCSVAVISAHLLEHFGVDGNNILSKIFTFLFYNFKSLHYISFDGNVFKIGLTVSAVIYSLFYLLVVIVCPLFINKKKLLGLDTKEVQEAETAESLDDILKEFSDEQ